MKYSILVLGASISIALFIRICCCLEANLDQELEMEDLLSGTADEVYEKALRKSLRNAAKTDNTTNQDDLVDDIVRNVIQEIKIARSTPHLLPKLQTQASHRSTMGFDSDLCGYTDPPEIGIRSCEDSDGFNICEVAPLPESCEYKEETKTLICSDLTHVPPLPPSLELNELLLHENKILKVSEAAFRNVTIKVIRLYRNSLYYIHPWAFHDVNRLTTLFIANNQISYLPYDLYVGLEDTIFIDLQYNRISLDIYRTCPLMPIDHIPLVLPKLSIMTLDGNPLNVIPKQMFAGLRESPLTTLSLVNCYLKEIDEGAFSYLKNLAILNLSQNPAELVTSVEKFAKALQPLTSLFKIYLSDLKLPDFPTEALYYVRNQLKYIELSKNLFYNLKQSDLSQFPNLEELYLDDCAIQIIEPDAFAGNPNLKVLTLRNNEIRQLPHYFPPNLESLALSNTQQTQLGSPPVCFKNLKKLRTLDMSKIKIDKISNNTFIGLSALSTIFITDCNVHSIQDGSFKDLTNLKTMILDNNPLSEIRQETFIGLNSLTTLNMQNCTLSSTSIITNGDGLFKFAPNLETLKLTKNNIIKISADLFQNLSKLCYIHLSENPIESWDERLFPDRITTVYDTTSTNISCFPELYISNGRIHFVKPEMLQDFLRISVIDLSDNSLVCDRGACDFKNLITKSMSTYKQTWINSENYRCTDSITGTDYLITDLSDEMCKVDESKIPESSSSDSAAPSSSPATTLITIIASLSLLTAVIIILAYRNRAHLRYFWFAFKFKVIPISPRKAKISTMESESDSECGSYDYDVFISYHHDDANFIEDVFLPEIEQQEESSIEPAIIEARNTIYFIENDDEIIKRNNNINEKSSSKPKFKVCLHERDFAAGVPITENIVNCVDRSKKTVIFVSKKYMESQWCSYELNLAYHRLVESRRKTFLLVLMEEVPVESRGKVLSFLMVSKTYLQWPGENGTKEDREAFWKRLRLFLKS